MTEVGGGPAAEAGETTAVLPPEGGTPNPPKGGTSNPPKGGTPNGAAAEVAWGEAVQGIELGIRLPKGAVCNR